MYGESPAGPLTTDFRRGSVGGVPNRENNAARDFSDGFYFRRARFGVEGTIARDFNYRLLLELGGSGTEGPTRINDAWIAYTGFAPFTFQLGASRRRPTWTTAPSPEDLLFIERASASELSRSLGGADGRIGLGVKASGTRWMSALTFTTRTVNDAEVFDTQLAAVGRARLPRCHLRRLQRAPGRVGNLRVLARRPGPGHDGRAIRCASATGPRSASTACASSTPAPSTPSTPASTRVEFGGNWKNFYLQGEHFWYDVERRALGDARRSGFHGLLPAGQLDIHAANAAATTRPRAHSRIRGPWCLLRATAASAPGNWRRATAA